MQTVLHRESRTRRRNTLAVCCILTFSILVGPTLSQKRRGRPASLRGYTIMAGGLGRPPRDAKDMWSNTAKAHLDFIERAGINLVVIEIPYGVSKRFPKSASTVRFIKQLRKQRVEVWVIYPHVLAQTFDLSRQVEPSGKRVEWKVCCNRQSTQDWLVENGKSIVEAYKPDGLLLFGLFHKGGACICEPCKKDKEARSGKVMERFFRRFSRELRATQAGIKLGTTGFWTRPSRKTLGTVDIVAPVIGIFRPGYAKKGRVKKALSGMRGRYKGKLLIPYVKLFLASQTNSKTEDVIAAAREGISAGDGFFMWGYNPGHGYEKQDYDHKKIESALLRLAGSR